MVSIREFQQLELRVGEILEANPHPNADRLYILRLKVGQQEKQTVAGIRSSYSTEELIGKKVVMVNNLEPATIRGVESQGMVLAVSEGEKVILLTVDRDVASGALVR